MLEAAAGMFVYFVVMAENGFLPGYLFGLRKAWDSSSINDLEDSYGQEWTYVNRKRLEITCHTAFFISILVVQWSNLLICKTQRSSVFTKGMSNWVLNFSLVFETLLAAFFCYTPGLDKGFNMLPLKFEWWLPAIPFSILLFVFEELRKMIIRSLSPGSWFESEI
jgi:sodium/potassium-transporting ATPase subunit alpha